MQVEQERICAECGSTSAPDASFCWRCLRPFAQLPPPPDVRRDAPSLVRTPWPTASTPTKARSRPSKALRAVITVVAAVGGYLGVQALFGSNLSLPDTLAGAERMTDPESKRFEGYTAEQGDRYGIDAEGGVYGSSAGPEFFVILVDATAVETTDQLFDALVSGFSQAGATVDEAGAASGRRERSDYRCVSASADGTSAVACMWRDDGNVGIVFQAPGSLKGTRRLLWTIHDDVVG